VETGNRVRVIISIFKREEMEKFEQAGISEFVLSNSYSCDGQRKENEESRLCGTLGEQ
jgi:hypothetical protein